MLIMIGLLLMIVSFSAIHVAWRANEWREPLLEISNILMEEENPKLKQLNSRLKMKGTLGFVFIFSLYILGGLIVLIKYHQIWLVIIVCIIFLWLLKSVIGLIRAKYSVKIRLLSYLYSPYLFAWRRDFLKEYTDAQITLAICKACEVDSKEIVESDMDLKTFLLALHKHTRPQCEHEKYPQILEEVIVRGANMVRIR